MGGWNATCGITQLPIFKNDKVVAFILKKNEYAKDGGGGFSYADSLYKQVLLPFTAEYDGYGGLINVDLIGDIVLDSFNQYLDKIKYNPKELKPENIEELIEQINDKAYPGIGFMLVHEEIYNIFIDETSTRGTFLDDKPLPEYFDDMVSEFVFETYKNIEVNSKKDLLKGNEDLILTFSLSSSSRFEINDLLQSLDMFDYQKDIYFANKVILEKLKEIFIFRKAMAYSRKLWIPQAGAGSQADEYWLHCLASKYIIDKEKEYHDYYRSNFSDYEEYRNSLGRVGFVK